jgi:hypothetical protein
VTTKIADVLDSTCRGSADDAVEPYLNVLYCSSSLVGSKDQDAKMVRNDPFWIALRPKLAFQKTISDL